MRGETRRVRAPAGRGRHELHPGRARGRRLETHRQGVAQRQDARHGKERETLVDWYRSTMDKPKTLHPRYLSQEERIQIADRLRLGDSIRAIARLLGRDPGTVSREVERNRNPESGGYEPYRAQQKAADRLKCPKPRKAAEGTRLWDEIAAGLRRHWSPEQIANRLRLDFPDTGYARERRDDLPGHLPAGQGRTQAGAETRHEAGANRPQTPRRPRPQTPFPRTHGHDSGATPWRSRTGRSRAIGRAIPSPAAATKAPSARSSSAPPGSRSCCTCPTGTTPNTSSRPSSTRCSTCPNSCATA